ncbi:hypothetical protein CDL12_23890 [Handroanthus impetiginosus]|uniref:Uncharacterized protein n=1 Tax=Handroanthus impetiginosus TaxID=429701 RepID=A0A2G9GE68_9LAMI|nr:hypothetical protein CDL12_23890 [Handroanthus impetiginosus]
MASSENSSCDHSVSRSREKNRKESQVEFSEDEEALIIRMYNLVGERWSLIAGRIPGRTADEVKKYWRSRYPTRSTTRK